MNNFDTGTKVHVIVANPDGHGTRATTGIVMAGPRQSFYREDSHMVLLTSRGAADFAIQTNPDIMIVPVRPDGLETGTEVSVKAAQGRWFMGHVAAGPLTERAATSSVRRNGGGNLLLVLTEHGHLQHFSASRLYPY